MKAARFIWSHNTDQPAMPETLDTDVDHDCRFIVPAGDIMICQTCSRPDPPTEPWPEIQQPIQPFQDERSVIARTALHLVEKELKGGVTLRSTFEAQTNIATTRAESRRRRKIIEKDPGRGKAKMLHQEKIAIDPTTGKAHININVPPIGPVEEGLIFWTVRMVPFTNEQKETMKALARRYPPTNGLPSHIKTEG